MSAQDLLNYVAEERSYHLVCSDCEAPSDDYFNPQQAAELAARDGWRNLGRRVVCPKCASGYPVEQEKVNETDR